jgi:thioredoxin-related protein
MSSYTLLKSTAFGLFLTVLTSCYVTESYAQQQNIQWQPIEQVEQIIKKNRRKFVVLVYSNGNDGFRLAQNVFNCPALVKYLNDNFIVARFDASTRNDVIYRGKTYRYISQGGFSFNELAPHLLKGDLSLPTLVLFDENMDYFQSIQLRTTKEFERQIKFFGSDAYKSTPFNKYTQEQEGEFKCEVIQSQKGGGKR